MFTAAPSGLSGPRRQASALRPLLLAVDRGFDAGGSARIFAADLAEGGAGGLLLLQRGERLAEPQQRIRSLGRFFVFGGDGEEGFRRVAILLALEVALAEPVLRVPEQRVARIFLREVLHG